MLTYRVGAGGRNGNAKGMANYYLSSEHMPEMQSAMGAYYASNAKDGALAIPNPDMHKVVADKLEVDQTRPMMVDELTNLFNGKTAKGNAIEGKKESRNSYIDLTFSAPKSLSVALVLAPTQNEKEVLDQAHRNAVKSIMDYISKEIGTASIGDNTGNKDRNRKREPAHIAYVTVEHYTARPTVKVAMDGDTEIHQVAQGDPQRHTHVLVPNVAVTSDGRVTSLHQDGLRQRIHEWGSLLPSLPGD